MTSRRQEHVGVDYGPHVSFPVGFCLRTLTTASSITLRRSFAGTIALDESSLDDITEDLFPEAQNELMLSEYRRIIRAELESLESQYRPTDLLVLVPYADSKPAAMGGRSFASRGN